MIDDHDVAGDPHLVAVGLRIVERDRCNDARTAGIGYVEDGGAEIGAVGDVAHIGVASRDRHLAGAGEVEMAELAHVAGQAAAAVDDVHPSILSSAPKP